MQDKFKTIGQLALSTILAFVLFFYATSANYKKSDVAVEQQKSETYTHTLTNVPVTITYDSEKYFISGFSSTVSVDLTGSNRVILQRESDELTRTFQVTADLTKVETGLQTVPLQISNLPTGIGDAKVNPSELTVKIGRKVSKAFPVKGMIYSNQLAEGYMISKVTVNLDTVKVTTDEETMAKIDRIEAAVIELTDLSENYSGTARLQAVDAEGNALPAILSQTEVNIQVTVAKIKEESKEKTTNG